MPVAEKIDRKRQLRQEAAFKFSARGYHATSMRELADAVGIEPASIYSHFRSKDDLLWEIAIDCANDFHQTLSPIYLQQDINLRDKLQAMIVAHVEVVLRNRTAASVFSTEWQHLEEPRRTEYARLRERYEMFFRQTILDGVRQNLLLPVDERFATLTVLSALNWTHAWYKPDGELSPRQIGDKLASIMLDGLARSR